MKRKQKRKTIVSRIIAGVLGSVILVSNIFSMSPVRAAPNEKIEKLIMVGGTGLGQMSEAVDKEDYHDVKDEHGNVIQKDWNQHAWVSHVSNPFEQVDRLIPSNEEQASKTAVVVWLGEDYTETKIPGYSDYFDHDWLGRDASSIHKKPSDYSGTAIGRALAGYDYYILEEHKTPEVSGERPWEHPASEDAVPSDAVHHKYPKEAKAQAKKPVANKKTEIETVVKTRPVVDKQGNHVLDHNGNPKMETYEEKIPHEYVENYTYWTELKCRKLGYADVQNENGWLSKHVKVYVTSLAPYSRLLDKEEKDKQNKSTVEFNNALKSAASGLQFLDIFEEVDEHVPYYRDGLDVQKGRYYDDPTLQWIFHLIWNSILLANPNDAPPEPVDHTLYAISSSMTAYINKVLANGEDELTGVQSEHIGNAGGFLGYGDKDYGFSEMISSKMSKTSVVTDYSALLDQEKSTNEMYLYARYGYTLKDLGFDSVNVAGAKDLSRYIPGSLLYGAYLGSTMSDVIFSGTLDILQTLNPFQFLSHSHELADKIKFDHSQELLEKQSLEISGSMPVKDITVTGGLDTDGPTLTESSHVESYHIVANILDFFGDIYDGFFNIGYLAIIPGTLACLIAYLLLSGSKNGSKKWQKIKSFIMRFAFIIMGVPMLATIYTATLDMLQEENRVEMSAGSQLIASSILDFESWAKAYRLGPVDDVVIKSQKVEGSLIGEASEESIAKARQTTFAINKASGAISFEKEYDANNSMDYSVQPFKNHIKANKKAASECLSLIQKYMSAGYYHASDWESDTMSTFVGNHRNEKNRNGFDLVGRAIMPDDEASDKPYDNKYTLFDFFENTNNVDAWMDRDDNQDLISDTGVYKDLEQDPDHKQWSKFNLVGNGTLNTTDGALLGPTDDVVYSNKDNTIDKDSHTGVCPCTKTGLSTISLYNYLSTDFQDNQMVVYSNQDSTSMNSRIAHYSANMIGSGAFRVIYYLNCVAVMGVLAIIGVYYSLNLMIRIIKHGIHVLMSIPFALLGLLGSIVRVVITVFTMIIEIVGTIFAYSLVGNLLSLFVQMMETSTLFEKIADIGGGKTAYIFGPSIVKSPVLFVFGATIFVTISCVYFITRLWKYRRDYVIVTEYLLCRVDNAIVPYCSDYMPYKIHTTDSVWKRVIYEVGSCDLVTC